MNRGHVFALLTVTFVFVFARVGFTRSPEKQTLNFGVILPHSSFFSRIRAYKQKLKVALDDVKKIKFNFTSQYTVETPEMFLINVNPSPTDILNALCSTFLAKNVTAILYLSNVDVFGATTTSTTYFLQLAGYLGIPVLCWNADNSGLEQMSTNINLQLAPSVHHQCAAMLSILRRYKWHQFGIVTSQIAGHNDFLQAVRDLIIELEPEFRFTLLESVVMESGNQEEVRNQLTELANTETRIILLYTTREEAGNIFIAAEELGLTGKNYVWIVTHSVIGNLPDSPPLTFHPGMLGVHFDTGPDSLLNEIDTAVKVFAHGLELFLSDPRATNASLQPNLSCVGQGESRWSKGELFYRYLRNVSVPMNNQRTIEFNLDGTLKYAELDIMNLNRQLKWDKIGKWTSEGLDIKDIVWPGNAHVPPPGVPEKFHLKVVFLEEPAFINMAPPDPVSGRCINRGVTCKVGKDVSDIPGFNHSRNSTTDFCCSGLSIDLLQKYADDLGFTYDMFRVEDGYWGSEVKGKWNGLIAALLQNKADMVVTALKINSYREEVVDFTEPFMETGIAIVVAKKTGIVSPKAFLEPFDTISWVFILVIGIQVAALSIFFFEWLSPSGYGMKIQPPRDHQFSLVRTYWLVWAILFGAAVNVDTPRGYTARYMASVWAMFAVVFLAIYTANLAAFMITREEYFKLSGVEDPKLANPFSVQPPFRYGTVPYSNTEAVMQKNLVHIYRYMKPYSRLNILEGMKAVKTGELDAFIYDATVLQHMVGQDDDCKLLTVGSWYARTGYGLAFPKNSKYLKPFNRQMMIYRDNGDLERLQRFWLSGGCRPGKKDRLASKPLSLDQFMSAFLLLSSGILLAVLLMITEHIYFKYIRKHLAKTDTGGCCALLSLSMGRSLTFRGAVCAAQDLIRQHRCKDPLCDIHLWKVKHELDIARMRINVLENELESKNPQAYQRYGWRIGSSKSVDSGAMLRARDMTKNHVSTTETTEATKFHGGHYYKSVSTEIAEIETVL